MAWLCLLWQVHVFLKSSSWDTRIAAGQAIEAIAQNVPQWDPALAQKIKGMFEPQTFRNLSAALWNIIMFFSISWLSF